MPSIDYAKWDRIDEDESDEEPQKPSRPDDNQRLWNPQQYEQSLKEATIHRAINEDQKKHGKAAPSGNCFGCQEPFAQLRCGRCRAVVFCSRKCQQDSWGVHKFQCRASSKSEKEQTEQTRANSESLLRQAKAEVQAGGHTPTQDLIDAELARREKEGIQMASFMEAHTMRLALIVPFREQRPLQDRSMQLRQFVRHMYDRLEDLARFACIKEWKLLVVQQSDDGRKFNRGALLNAGFDILQKERELYHTVIFHDVDLLPLDMELNGWYAQDLSLLSEGRESRRCALHLASIGYPKHSGDRRTPSFIGGALAIRPEDFKAVDGFPNDCWGWAGERGEDGELLKRLFAKEIEVVECPQGGFKDLDRINMAEPTGEVDMWRWCEERFMRAMTAAEDAPSTPMRNASGKAVCGPQEPAHMAQGAEYSGGLSSLQYSVLRSGTCEIHATLCEVQLSGT